MTHEEIMSQSIEVLDLDVRTYNALKRAGINTIADIENQAEKLEKTIPSRYKAVMDRLSEYKGIPAIGSWVEKDMLGDELTFDDITNMVGELIVMDMSTESHEWYKVERVEAIIDGSDGKRHLRTYDGSKQRGSVNEIFFNKDCHNPHRAWRLKSNTLSTLPSPAQTEAAVPTDKYAEAVQLNAQIMTSARAAQQNLYDMAMGFKKMRDDKLYKELGYDNFGDYCEGETGMHRKNVYRYIDIVEKLPSNFVSSMTQIGMTKLQLLSTIDEEHRTEIIENTDLESTTVKELREQIEQLKQSEAKTKSQLEAAEEQNAVLSAEKEQFHRASKASLEKLNEERERNSELEQQIRELESRPVDVVVQSDSDAQRKFNETIRKLNLEFEIFRDDADKELADMRNQRNKALDRAEAAEAQLNAPKEESNVKPFLIKMTADDLSEIIEALSGSPKLQNIMKKVQVLRI